MGGALGEYCEYKKRRMRKYKKGDRFGERKSKKEPKQESASAAVTNCSFYVFPRSWRHFKI